MFDQNDQTMQATNATAQPAAGLQNTTTPDIADPNMVSQTPGDNSVNPDPMAASVPSAPMPQMPQMSVNDPATDASTAMSSATTPEPSLPTLDSSSTPLPTTEPVVEQTSAPAPVAEAAPTMEVSPTLTTATPDSGPASDDLLSIKKDALQNLTPLLDHLDQAPEDKFRTTMMLIQASDDKSLIQAAYTAAQQITDEKEKAQALLDIVNEINYFTQEPAEAAPEAK